MEREKLDQTTKDDILSKLSILLDSDTDWKFEASRQGNSVLYKPTSCYNKNLTSKNSCAIIEPLTTE